MSEAQRLQQQIDEQQRRWDRLSELIRRSQKDRDAETRSTEKARLDNEIDNFNNEREQVGNELRSLEEKRRKVIAQYKEDACRLETNKAFKEALEVWESIQKLDPDDPEAGNQIQRLQEKLQQVQQIDNYIGQLGYRIEIESIYPQVIKRLRQMVVMENMDGAILGIIEAFLQQNLSPENFLEEWNKLEEKTISGHTAEKLDYHALANRLKRSEIVLFLGSDIPRLLGIDVPDPESIIPVLAKKAHYDSFVGSLSKISEYYMLKHEYGRPSLIHNLQELLVEKNPQIPLYDLLAKIDKPLVLISATYDLFLENAFHKYDKKYVLIASIVFGSPEEIGKVFVRYSDQRLPDALCSEQKFSGIELLKQGYSLIYKIRGFCDAHSHSSDQEGTISLCEHNYFTFAHYFDKLIPSGIIREFTRRGLFFLGYSPRHWEDRLLAYAILDRRPAQFEPPCVITEDKDPFLQAYWDSPRAKRCEIRLQEFVSNLEKFIK